MAQLRFTARVGHNPSKSDLGLDHILIAPCTAKAVTPVLTPPPTPSPTPLPTPAPTPTPTVAPSLPLAPVVLASSVGRDAPPIVTVGGPKKGETCVFPFVYTASPSLHFATNRRSRAAVEL